MAESTTAAPAGGTDTSTPAAPARPTDAQRLAAAVESLGGKSPLPSTPEAPATKAVLEAEESASRLIRHKNELADGRRALEAERAAWQAEQKQKLETAERAERLLAEFERDPAAYFEARKGGRTPEQIARDLYIETCDIDKLPPEQRAGVLHAREQRRLEREIAKLRSEQERAQRETQGAEAQRALAAYRGQLAVGLAQITDSTPLIKELAAASPDTALSMLWQTANNLAEQGSKEILTAAQLAAHVEKALEQELAPWMSYYERKFKPAAPPVPEKKNAQPPPGIQSRGISAAVTDETPVRRRAVTEQERIAAATRALNGEN